MRTASNRPLVSTAEKRQGILLAKRYEVPILRQSYWTTLLSKSVVRRNKLQISPPFQQGETGKTEVMRLPIVHEARFPTSMVPQEGRLIPDTGLLWVLSVSCGTPLFVKFDQLHLHRATIA